MESLRIDLVSAWEWAKEKHGFAASQSDWTAAIDSENMDVLKSIHRKCAGDWSLNRLAFSIIK
tara:strand:- start:86 stop:274 length:189 start_codon:yes stop_codon:yes gene_type:complete